MTKTIAFTVGGIAAAAVVVFVLNFVMIGSRPYPAVGNHQNRSIEMAFNWVECGEYSSISLDQGIRIAYRGTLENLTAVESLDRPFEELAETQAGSTAAYCDLPFGQQKNEDSSLFYLLSSLLRLWPGASLAQLYVLGTAILSLGFALIGYAMWVWTRSVVLSAGTVLAVVLWYTEVMLFSFMGNHMFGWIFLLFAAFLMAWVVSEVASGRIWRAAFIALAAGLTAAFAANMRSTVQVEIPFLVIATGISVMAATPSGTKNWWRSRKVGHAGVLLGLFAIAWLAYGRVAIAPYEAIDEGGLTVHPIGHVLVIGLAVPYGDLARDEGILWLDERGFQIAERYRPGSTATMQQYDDAMIDYYFDLWQDRPGDMVRTYVDKANITGTSLYPQLRNIGVGWISPLNLITNGLVLGGILALLTLYSFMFSIGSPVAMFLVRSLLISALGGYFVSMVIFPVASFYIPELPFTFILLTVVFWWAIVRLALMAALRYNVAQNGWTGSGLRFVQRWW